MVCRRGSAERAPGLRGLASFASRSSSGSCACKSATVQAIASAALACMRERRHYKWAQARSRGAPNAFTRSMSPGSHSAAAMDDAATWGKEKTWHVIHRSTCDHTCCWVGLQHKLESLGGNLEPTPCSSPLCFSHRAISSRSLRSGLLDRFALWLNAPAFTLPETRAAGVERSLLLNADVSMERLRRCSRSPTVTAQRSQPTGAVEC